MKYLEKLKYLSCKYSFAYLFLIYVINKKITDIKNLLNEAKSIIYVYEDYELIEVFKENNEKLKPNLVQCLPEEDYIFNQYKMNKLTEIIYNNINDFKSNCEDGWELFEYNKDNFLLEIEIELTGLYGFIEHNLIKIIHSYIEHNSLGVFFQYYAKYFFFTLQPEFTVNMTAYTKMFPLCIYFRRKKS